MKKPLSPSFHRGKPRAPDPERLDRLAAEALTYLAAEPERLKSFFAVTGLSVETLRQAAGTPDFTAHLLDYMAADERRLLAFASEAGYEPSEVEAIRLALSTANGES